MAKDTKWLTLNDKTKAKAKKGLITAGIIAAAIVIIYFAGMAVYRGAFRSKHIGSAVNEQGTTVEERFRTPEGFERVQLDINSAAAGYRKFPLKTIGLAVYSYEGIRDFDADLGGVLDRDKEDIDTLFRAADAEKLSAAGIDAIKPGDAVKAGERVYAVMDVCRDPEGKTLALLAELRDGYEKYIIKGGDGAYGGYWIDLAAGFTDRGASYAADSLTFLTAGD